MNKVTFKEGLEALVKKTVKLSQNLPAGVSPSEAEYEFHDVLGYQVKITIGKDILEEDED